MAIVVIILTFAAKTCVGNNLDKQSLKYKICKSNIFKWRNVRMPIVMERAEHI